jgi:hypothetical protein
LAGVREPTDPAGHVEAEHGRLVGGSLARSGDGHHEDRRAHRGQGPAAVSGEIVLERLAATLLRAAIENAEAQRGALFLPYGDKLSVVSIVDPSPEDSAAGADESRLPWTLIAYTQRTREHVLIGDASQPHPFSADPWLKRGRAHSVLCLPLVREEAFRGVLYLENGLTTNAFTPSRLVLLGLLASQAAISIENARLYAEVQRAEAALRAANDELEKRVEERTHELKQAQPRWSCPWGEDGSGCTPGGPRGAHAQSCPFPPLSCSTSRRGDRPYSRRYSRLNCEGL